MPEASRAVAPGYTVLDIRGRPARAPGAARPAGPTAIDDDQGAA